jgi:hypothetical protein
MTRERKTRLAKSDLDLHDWRLLANVTIVCRVAEEGMDGIERNRTEFSAATGRIQAVLLNRVE